MRRFKYLLGIGFSHTTSTVIGRQQSLAECRLTSSQGDAAEDSYSGLVFISRRKKTLRVGRLLLGGNALPNAELQIVTNDASDVFEVTWVVESVHWHQFGQTPNVSFRPNGFITERFGKVLIETTHPITVNAFRRVSHGLRV